MIYMEDQGSTNSNGSEVPSLGAKFNKRSEHKTQKFYIL